MTHHHTTYPPLNTLKPVADDLWIVDGPEIRFGMPGLKMPFPTRMTVIRLPGNRLFIHSPTPLTDGLVREIAGIGKPAFIIGPNRIHYWWIPDWRTAFPGAEVWLAPRIAEQSKGRIDFPAHELTGSGGYAWDRDIDTLPVRGNYMTEVVFFHRPSRTLVLTDLIENFETRKLGLVGRWLTWLGSAQDPDGQMPRDMRMTYPREVLSEAVGTMIGWEPERVIVAHGRWYEKSGTDELKRAFRWLLR